MNKSILYLIFSIDAVFCFSQAPDIEWQNTIGGSNTDDLYSVEQTTDGGYILGGFSSSPMSGDKTEGFIGFHDYWVIKLDSIGNIQWQNTIGGDGDDKLFITQTSYEGYILGGSSNSGISGDKTDNSFGGYDYWVIKLNAIGSIMWQKTFGGNLDDKLYSLAEAEDGGFILGGYSLSGISGNKSEANLGEADYWVVRIDDLGNIIWQKTIGGSANDVLYSLQLTLDNSFILFGSSNSGISGDKTEPSILSPFGTNTDDYWVVKIDSLGIIQWQNTIGGNSNDEAGEVKQSNDGGFLLAGYSMSALSGDKTESLIGIRDYWIVKLDSSGSIEWQNTIGGAGSEGNYDVYISNTSAEGCIIGGSSESGISGDKTEASFGYFDYWLVKLDSIGNIEWDKTLGGYNYDVLRSIHATTDEGYILGGWSSSNISGVKTENSLGDVDYWVIKLEGSCDPLAFFEDADGDGYGNKLSEISACIAPPGYVTDSTDCDDYNSLIYPGATEICNGVDDNCNFGIDEGLPLFTYYSDVDSDGFGNILSSISTCLDIPPVGYTIDSSDCDDANNLIYEPITYYADIDNDFYGDALNSEMFCSLYPPEGYVANNLDCNDYNNLINPASNEICNNIDDNCNTEVDEGLPVFNYFLDADNDTYGNPISDTTTCQFELIGYVSDSADCDDSNPLIYPGATEILNGLDDNCNGIIDEGLVAINNSNSFEFELYPNPNNGNFQISFSNFNMLDVSIDIYSLIGEKIDSRLILTDIFISVILPNSFSGIALVIIRTSGFRASQIITVLD